MVNRSLCHSNQYDNEDIIQFLEHCTIRTNATKLIILLSYLKVRKVNLSKHEYVNVILQP